jgi:hypothetical protein
MREMQAPVRPEIIPGATHLFEEAGKLEEVGRVAAEWFAGILRTVKSWQPSSG